MFAGLLLILGLLVVYPLVRGFTRAKLADMRRTRRLYDEARAAAMATLKQGDFDLPTWKSDLHQVSAFLKTLRQELATKGISAVELDQIADDGFFKGGALTAAAAFEARGFSFAGQIVGTSDFMEWAMQKGLGRQIVKNRMMADT
ncbi:hypothetical protein [Flavimaricola marinus]|uniref:Uncharacterized protein n=1 Tax=Flavimaricola marinus TaxID=1819565 RepID=A0A238LD07_9RHOB|nr:hypothetical protein [Flavimaricola marinus]SMY06826.1 hypothetical protein LOM8899_00956 [Flavimaricola marinus]